MTAADRAGHDIRWLIDARGHRGETHPECPQCSDPPQFASLWARPRAAWSSRGGDVHANEAMTAIARARSVRLLARPSESRTAPTARPRHAESRATENRSVLAARQAARSRGS